MPQQTDAIRLESLRMNAPVDHRINEIPRDPARFGSIYRAYLNPVYRYILARVSNHADAEDLTSQVFMTALEGLSRYKEQGSFAAWLFSIARRKVADHFRAQSKIVPLDYHEDMPAPENDYLRQIVAKEELNALTQQISRLPEEEQELLRLRFAAQLTFDEIATVLNRKTSAVKMAYYRLLNRLENQMEVNND